MVEKNRYVWPDGKEALLGGKKQAITNVLAEGIFLLFFGIFIFPALLGYNVTNVPLVLALTMVMMGITFIALAAHDLWLLKTRGEPRMKVHQSSGVTFSSREEALRFAEAEDPINKEEYPDATHIIHDVPVYTTYEDWQEAQERINKMVEKDMRDTGMVEP